MNNLFIKGLVEKKGENNYRIVASTDSIDRQGDVIDQNGWIIDSYMKNPVMLWAHDYSALPVAKCINLAVESAGLVCEFEFAPAEANPVAGQLKMLYDEGFMNAVSVGFIPKEQNGNIITKAELLEISFVPVPANQDALRLAMAKGLDISLIEKDITKGEVADVLEQEEQSEMKQEKWEEVMEAISAMWSVYFKPETPVEDFKKLLTETIVLLQDVVDSDGIDADDEEETEEEKGIKKESVEKFTSFISEKIGRQISEANHKKLKELHSHIKNASVVVEDLMASAQSGNDSAVEDRSVALQEEVEVKEAPKDVLVARSNLVIAGKNFELAMKAINEFIKLKESKN